ncbi:hypothetical protein P3L10_001525 [Capsicum annuum]
MQKGSTHEEFALKQTAPKIVGLGMMIGGDKETVAYGLVEQMEYLYVRVVKAKELTKDVTGSFDPYVEVKVGNYKGITKHFEKKTNPEWNNVFAFSQDRLQASYIEVCVKDKDVVLDEMIGRIVFDLIDVPKRVPSDSSLAPQWYRLEDKRGEKLKKGEIMLAVWRGTQADDAFCDAWHSDAAAVGSEGISRIRGKVYLSPRLWYIRALKTNICPIRSVNPMWNEDLVFVVAEPFEEPLVITVEDKVGSNFEFLGKCVLPLSIVPRRLDNKPVPSKWHNLEKHTVVEGEKKGD